MIALKILNVKKFMAGLLKEDCFDRFLLQEASIQAGCGFTIDGRLRKDFYSEDELEEQTDFIPYFMVKEKCYELIRGKKTPAGFQFVFLLSPENLRRTIESAGTSFTPLDVSAMAMTIRFQNGELTLMTGISYKTFSMDKSLDAVWDSLVKKFLTKNEFDFEEM